MAVCWILWRDARLLLSADAAWLFHKTVLMLSLWMSIGTCSLLTSRVYPYALAPVLVCNSGGLGYPEMGFLTTPTLPLSAALAGPMHNTATPRTSRGFSLLRPTEELPEEDPAYSPATLRHGVLGVFRCVEHMTGHFDELIEAVTRSSSGAEPVLVHVIHVALLVSPVLRCPEQDASTRLATGARR